MVLLDPCRAPIPVTDPTHLLSDILIGNGPLTHHDVIRRLANAGVTDAEDAFEYLLAGREHLPLRQR